MKGRRVSQLHETFNSRQWARPLTPTALWWKFHNHLELIWNHCCFDCLPLPHPHPFSPLWSSCLQHPHGSQGYTHMETPSGTSECVCITCVCLTGLWAMWAKIRHVYTWTQRCLCDSPVWVQLHTSVCVCVTTLMIIEAIKGTCLCVFTFTSPQYEHKLLNKICRLQVAWEN